jgi:tetratricopeptide (TPR) repeat protein
MPPVEEDVEEEYEDEDDFQEDESHVGDTVDDEEEIDVEAIIERARESQDRGEYGPAIAEYQELIRLLPTEPEGFNGLAWILATCPDTRFRNGARAVQFARRAVDLQTKSGEPVGPEGLARVVAIVEYQKTLAAAHAEAGDFAAALATLETALASAPAAERARLATYRVLYRMRRPYREVPPPLLTKS